MKKTIKNERKAYACDKEEFSVVFKTKMDKKEMVLNFDLFIHDGHATKEMLISRMNDPHVRVALKVINDELRVLYGCNENEEGAYSAELVKRS